jgi:hypothetical protein
MKQYLPFLINVIYLMCALVSCMPPLGGGGAGEAGALTISFTPAGIANRTILPDTDMNTAGYIVSGAGPNGASFQAETTQTSVTVNKLAFGEWSVTVEAVNAGGIIIGSGTQGTTVHTGQNSLVSVTVRPLEGYGTLDLAVNWNAEDTEVPSLDATLVPPAGSALVLGFEVSGGNTGVYRNEMIPTGYYTLIVKLLDNEVSTMGAVEVVRIVKDGTSAGSFDFTEINKPGGSISVEISPEMGEPLTVSIEGAAAELPQGGSMTVSADVAEDVGNVVYVWYLNGAWVGTGDTITLGSGLEVDSVNRLDVTAITSDGTRAGDASAEFHVVEPAVP